MSKIQKLPQEILMDITPHLRSDEVVGKALYQDNQLPTKVWLVETSQSIVFYGQEPDKKPVVMVCPADEIKEIDYLQKDDIIQVVFYYANNNGKAGFRFKKEDSKEIDEFLMNFSDLITARYRDQNGKVRVLQRALPIGHKDRKVFGKRPPTITKEAVASKPQIAVQPKEAVVSKASQGVQAPKPQPATVQPEEVVLPKPQPAIQPKEATDNACPDYGSPAFFIGATVIATILGFFCLSLFKNISRFSHIFSKK